MSTEATDVQGRSATRGRRRRIAIGSALLVTAAFLLAIGFVRASSDPGFPWDTSVGGPVDGPVAITITFADGRVETHEAATHEDAQAFVARRHRELKREFGLDDRASQGRWMVVGGGLVALVGVVIVVRRPRQAASG